jgi:hypothetical protein
MEEGRKRVVVVGGGVAGSLTSKLLENAADVTLVDPYSLSLFLCAPLCACHHHCMFILIPMIKPRSSVGFSLAFSSIVSSCTVDLKPKTKMEIQ